MKNNIDYRKIWEEANEIAANEVKTLKIEPMLLRQEDLRGNQFGQTYIIPDGPCGFASITIRPASPKGRRDAPFVKWARHLGLGSYSHIDKCWRISVSEYNQSYLKKDCHARVVANYLSNEGINASYESRID